MEAELTRAVLVTVTGTRPTVDLASTAEALHREFDIGPADMSIRPYYPEDLLVLCKDGALRERMVRSGKASASWFDLKLRPWIRQAQSTVAHLPFLVPVLLRGAPAHAWSQGTTAVILRGLGYVVGVDDSIARQHDMADFRVWLRTDRPRMIPRRRLLFIDDLRRTLWAGMIPRRRLLFIDELRRTLWAGAVVRRVTAVRCATTLWYPVDITVLAELTLVDSEEVEDQPPPSPPTGDDDWQPSAGAGRPSGGGAHSNGGSGAAGSGEDAVSMAGSSMKAPLPGRQGIQTAWAPATSGVRQHDISSCVAAVTGSGLVAGPSLAGEVCGDRPFACDRMQPREEIGQVDGLESAANPTIPCPLVASCVAPRPRLQAAGPAVSPASVQLSRWMLGGGTNRVGSVQLGSLLLDLSGLTGEDGPTFVGRPTMGGIRPWDLFQVSLSEEGDLHIDGMPHARHNVRKQTGLYRSRNRIGPSLGKGETKLQDVSVTVVQQCLGNQYQTESKHRETFCGFFMDQKTPDGPEQHLGAQPTKALLGAQACPVQTLG
ncbi:hypothetical protein TRIUR3_16846 [Triticum urartu]|uniref:DUF4283 domain-containing protein n=1 Tax=Triticum urartu TaxID=4572 RepID=M7YUY2_TRIUA|nr:hypothetical protein TRIUR3_16846 [Triticum urartu]